jgi:iron complex outermembrane recepter protein
MRFVSVEYLTKEKQPNHHATLPLVDVTQGHSMPNFIAVMAPDAANGCLQGVTQWTLLVASAMFMATPALASTSEADFLTDLPVIFSVTRLPQALADTPGAVTVLDREMIRQSGARELADLLRLVPGYLVSGWNGANPVGLYHSVLDEFGTRNQVLIDGRSVYSNFYQGDTHRGTMSVVLEDVERIEVLRGSNSAAYGANAFLGVINIVTRHAAETQGAMVAVTSGDNDVADAMARIGWASESANASFRLSAGQRTDSGYLNAFDDKRFTQAHFRADLKTSTQADLTLAAGTSELRSGEGFAGDPNNLQRTTVWTDAYVQARWNYAIAPNQEILLNGFLVTEEIDDNYGFLPVPGVVIDSGGKAQRMKLEAQHILPLMPGLRLAWGGAVQRETVKSIPLYATNKLSFQTFQLFGNVEWTPHPKWVINSGLFIEDHQKAGSQLAPRLALNFKATPNHTIRAIATRAFRQPTSFELAGDVRYYLGNLQLGRGVRASGNAVAEKIESIELGYLGEFPRQQATLDVRLFRERTKDVLRVNQIFVLPALPATGTVARDYSNLTGPTITGIEYQLRWKPWTGANLIVNQAFMHATVDDFVYAKDYLLKTPRHIGTIALMQALGHQFDLSVIATQTDTVSWRGAPDRVDNGVRLDLRLGYRFKVGITRAEIALTTQAANGAQLTHIPTRRFQFDRHRFATLKIDF